MARYFFNIQTGEELKKAYKELAKKLHPDNGGNADEFKAMQDEFSTLFNVLKNVHVNKNGEKWEATGEQATTETAQEFMNIIEKLMFIPALNVELCGSWIWVGGDTKTYKELLKELTFRYSANKKMWYYHKEGNRKFHKKAWTIDQIRNVYGTQQFKEDKKVLEA